ncbi:MAG: RNase adapter RapZ [Armatimonadetes bacterium]|nr:RNase adapter RapZ [Armatimonadota bacterium]
MQFVIITGLSGAGKSTAMRVFEDLGFFCVDNLPPALLPKFAELCLQSEGRVRRVALVMDIRGGEFFKDLVEVICHLEETGFQPQILFLDASDDVLDRRFKETRRKHPLAQGGSVLEGIREERRRLQAVKERGHKIIDTTNLSVRALRQEIAETFLRDTRQRGLVVTVLSFGYKYGIPLDADLVFDVRFLPNPHYDERLRPLPGSSRQIREFVLGQEMTQAFMHRLNDLLDFMLPRFVDEGKAHLTIALGCTGGRHRSVVLGEELGVHLRTLGYQVRVKHRDVRKERVPEMVRDGAAEDRPAEEPAGAGDERRAAEKRSLS